MSGQYMDDAQVFGDQSAGTLGVSLISELAVEGDFVEECCAENERNLEWDEFKTAGDEQPDAARIYLRAMRRSRLLTAEEERLYGHLVQQGDLSARRIMIESNLRLVVKISRRYLYRGLPQLDLIEEGNLGLIHAVEKFKPELGFRFSTYATWWIRQTIERALINQTRTVRLPVHVVKELNVCLKAFRRLSATLNHEPTLLELAQHLDKPVESVEKIMQFVERVISMDVPVRHDSEKTLLDSMVDDDEPSLPDILQADILTRHIFDWLAQLNEKQQEVISRRYGLHGCEQSSLEEISRDMGLTRERVRQIQIESLRLLREAMETEGFSIDAIFH